MFHWIGQPFTSCDQCGWPAWDHPGLAVPERDVPFGGMKLRVWEPGEAEAIRAKWERPRDVS
jgi:hypothetical protein